MKLKLIVKQDHAQGSREYQQDRYAVTPETEGKGMLSVLCDGMGGMTDGEKFAEMGCESMLRSFNALSGELDIMETLFNCYAHANEEAIAMQSDDSAESGGSTLTAVLIRQDMCGWLSSGDSRIYLYRGGGLIQLTRDQNMGAILDTRAGLGDIDWDLAKSAKGRNALTGHLGMENSTPCDSSPEPFRLLPGDSILQMSDGVHGTLSESEIIACLNDREDPAQRIIASVLEKKKARQDNCSVTVINVQYPFSDAAGIMRRRRRR